VTRRENRPTVDPKDRAAWRRWLERHHATSGPIWLALLKKGSVANGVTYEDAVLEALCFGWIDSTANPLDDDHYLIRMSRRKPGSGWSLVNKRRIDGLVAEGRLAPAGLAAIETAKADGSWSKLDASHSLEVPKDLAAAFRRHAGSRKHFDAFPPSARRAILEWIDGAKRPETRAKRVEETARLAQDDVRAHQPGATR
jgi:uncharacterized protein YdeI (YjbR/CyaY-like superfamily)